MSVTDKGVVLLGVKYQLTVFVLVTLLVKLVMVAFSEAQKDSSFWIIGLIGWLMTTETLNRLTLSQADRVCEA